MQLPVTVIVTNHRAGGFSSVHSVIRVCGIVIADGILSLCI